MRKIIITGDSRGDGFGCNSTYVNFFAQFGTVFISSVTDTPEDIVRAGDVLVLPGGADVNPTRYRSKPHIFTGNSDPILEWADTHLIDLFIARKKPIIGICRGLQTLNVQLGGTLFQHLWLHPTSTVYRSDLVHKVTVVENNLETVMEVNSLHHQGIDRLAPGLTPIAFYNKGKKDQLVEAFEDPARLLFAVQWHPEEFERPGWTIDKISRLLNK